MFLFLPLSPSLSLCPSSGSVQSLEITSTGPTSIEKASGQTVKLDCQFSLAPEDSGPLDIEWSLLASDNQKEDKVVSAVCAVCVCVCQFQCQSVLACSLFYTVK